MSWSAHGHLRQQCYAVEGGRSGYGPSPQDLPAKRRPIGSNRWAKGPHSSDCVPLPEGGWRIVPEVELALRLAPQSVPLGGSSNV